MPFEKSAEYYDAIYVFRDYAKDARALHRIIEKEKRSPGRDLLDVGCGTGLHMAHLKRWYRVEGLDLDPNMLRVARRRLPKVPLHRGDMTRFDLGKKFDVVLNLFGSIGYVRNKAALHRTAKAMELHLKPGGVLAVEPWLLRENFIGRHVIAQTAQAGETRIARVSRSFRRGNLARIEFGYLVASPSGIRTIHERHTLGLYSRGEYTAAFQDAGLRVQWNRRGLFGGRGLIICRKP